VATNVYALVAIIKKKLPLEIALYTFFWTLSVRAFEKIPLNQLLTDSDAHESFVDASNQLFFSTYEGTALLRNISFQPLVNYQH